MATMNDIEAKFSQIAEMAGENFTAGDRLLEMFRMLKSSHETLILDTSRSIESLQSQLVQRNADYTGLAARYTEQGQTLTEEQRARQELSANLESTSRALAAVTMDATEKARLLTLADAAASAASAAFRTAIEAKDSELLRLAASIESIAEAKAAVEMQLASATERFQSDLDGIYAKLEQFLESETVEDADIRDAVAGV